MAREIDIVQRTVVGDTVTASGYWQDAVRVAAQVLEHGRLLMVETLTILSRGPLRTRTFTLTGEKDFNRIKNQLEQRFTPSVGDPL